MLIVGLLGMYFDAAVVFVTSQTLLFRLALAILCTNKVDLKPRHTLIVPSKLKGYLEDTFKEDNVKVKEVTFTNYRKDVAKIRNKLEKVCSQEVSKNSREKCAAKKIKILTESVTNFEVKMQMAKGCVKNEKKIEIFLILSNNVL